ncbi:SH3 domain-containing protein [Leptospira meyeri]|nr:SH3 domain-containing protein [Leptospira meyeri]TGL52839.1 SH3 domain-containing protein [Leptospira meyeri]
MKTFLIQIIILSSSILKAQESISLNIINEKTRLYEKPSFSAKSIEMLNEGSELEVLDFDNKIQKNNGMNGIWIKIEYPFGWIFSSNLNIDTSLDVSCDFNFNSVRKLSFNNFEIIFLKKQLVILSSFDLGNSFNQQIGTWKWEENRIVSSVKFTDSTMTDC